VTPHFLNAKIVSFSSLALSSTRRMVLVKACPPGFVRET
jgi:hypothetical protein